MQLGMFSYMTYTKHGLLLEKILLVAIFSVWNFWVVTVVPPH